MFYGKIENPHPMWSAIFAAKLKLLFYTFALAWNPLRDLHGLCQQSNALQYCFPVALLIAIQLL
jgi:hypothetical protein